MTTASIVYCSDTWTTAGLAEDIAGVLRGRGIEAVVNAIDDVDPATLADVDYAFLGCWTHGWFVVNQHPVPAWVAWAGALPRLDRPRVALFTTYKIRTGSMFSRMRRALRASGARVELELQARGTHLTEDGRRRLEALLDEGTRRPS